MNSLAKKLIICSGLILCSLVTIAQPPDPGGGQDDPNCFPPPCIPIDGGLSWLLIAGVAYGGKKMFDLNKDQNPTE